MKKYHFTYITTNLINGKQYVGSHSTDNINDNYIGSGKILKLSIKKYGREKFKREILESCSSNEESRNLEEFFIKEYNTLKPLGYNIVPNGLGGSYGHKHSKESLEKMSKWQKGKTYEELYDPEKAAEKKRRLREIKKGKETWMKGKKHSKESLEKMSKSHKGQIVSNKTKIKISESLKGRIFTEEHRKKLSETSKGRKLSEKHKQKLSEYRKGKSPSNKGKKMLEEQKIKMKEIWKKRKEGGWVSPLKGRQGRKITKII